MFHRVPAVHAFAQAILLQGDLGSAIELVAGRGCPYGGSRIETGEPDLGHAAFDAIADQAGRVRIAVNIQAGDPVGEVEAREDVIVDRQVLAYFKGQDVACRYACIVRLLAVKVR